MLNKEICNVLDIKVKYKVKMDGALCDVTDIGRYRFDKLDNELILDDDEYMDTSQEFIPDFLADNKKSSYNRELLEKCILDTFVDIPIVIKQQKDETYIKVYTCENDNEYFIGYGETKTKALIDLLECIAENDLRTLSILKEEVNKVKERFLY